MSNVAVGVAGLLGSLVGVSVDDIPIVGKEVGLSVRLGDRVCRGRLLGR